MGAREGRGYYYMWNLMKAGRLMRYPLCGWNYDE